MRAWILPILIVLTTIFVAGLFVGKAMAMIDGLEQGVSGFDSMSRWRFWR